MIRHLLAKSVVIGVLVWCFVPATRTNAQLSYSLTWGWAGDGREVAANAALDNTVNRFNAYGDFTGGNGSNVEAAYNPGVPTAQANYGGWGGIIEYGGTWPNDRVTQHELNHWLGTGTYSNANGLGWDGPRTLEIFEQFEGVGARINTDGTHFWPYGLNFDSEWSELNAQRNVALTYALRADWGIGSTANPAAWNATSVSLTSSDPFDTSGFNHFSTWSDSTFAHPNADYATGAFDLRTPQGYPSWTFYGASLTVNSGGRLLYNSWGTNGTVTINNLILDGGTVRHDQFPQDRFRLNGNVTLASDSTFDAGQGNIEVSSSISGSGSLTKVGSNTMTLTSANGYSGNTNVSAGTLELISSGTTGYGTTTLYTGTTLRGDGTIRGALNAQAGSTVIVGSDGFPMDDGVISFNVERWGTIPRNATNSAGVVDAPFWNDGWGNYGLVDGTYNGATASDLWDDSGVATTVDASFGTYGTWTENNLDADPGLDADGTNNKRLLHGYLNAGEATWGPPITVSSVTLNDIPYDQYDVYVYFNSSTNNRIGEISDGSSTYLFTSMGPDSTSGASATFAQTTNTVNYSTSANYAVFSGLSGDSQTFTSYFPVNDDWGGIAGFQIVADPNAEPLPGEMEVVGDLSLVAGTTLRLDIAAPGINDSIDIGGTFSVADGVVLEVQLDGRVSASSLQLGDSWDLFDFDPNGTSGSFNANGFILPDGLASGLAWDTSNLLTTGVLAVASAFLPGDFNIDGHIDGLDFLAWQRNPGVGNLAEWEANYGLPVSSNSTAVPEPSVGLLLLTSLCSMVLRRRRFNAALPT